MLMQTYFLAGHLAYRRYGLTSRTPSKICRASSSETSNRTITMRQEDESASEKVKITILARPPIDRRGDLVGIGKLKGFERADDLVKVPSNNGWVGERQTDLPVRIDDEDGADCLGQASAFAYIMLIVAGLIQHVVED